MSAQENGLSEDSTGRSFLFRRRAELACALLLLLMAANMLTVIRQKSLTIDELVMIPAGYYHLVASDMRPVNEHPPFAKVLSAIPLVAAGAEGPPIDGPASEEYGYEYFLNLFTDFWRANDSNYERLTFWARVPMVMVTLLLGVLVFVFARGLFGPRAALFTVALFAFEPTMLAHGRVVQTDVPSALAYLLFAFALYHYVRRPGLHRAALVGLAVGLGVVTKFSMVVLGPIAGLALLVAFILAPRIKKKRAQVAGHALVVALAAVLAVNAAYLFNHREPDPYEPVLEKLGLPAWADETFRAPLAVGHSVLQKILPPDFVYGVGWQIEHNRDGHEAGLLGMHGRKGWWYYFPVAFSLKTTIPFLLLAVAGIIWGAWTLVRERDGRFLVLLVPLAIFTVLVMISSINIGVRYFLPAFPFMMILAGGMLDRVLKNARPRAAAVVLVAALFAWAGVEAVRAYPHQMSYVNQFASGAPHWWYLSDSNVEWGDDVRGLALYLRARGENRIRVALLSWQVLERYDVELAPLFVPPGEPPREETRYVALGASYLNGSTVPGNIDGVALTEEQRVNYFDEYRRRTPEKVFGNSIYLYRVKE